MLWESMGKIELAECPETQHSWALSGWMVGRESLKQEMPKYCSFMLFTMKLVQMNMTLVLSVSLLCKIPSFYCIYWGNFFFSVMVLPQHFWGISFSSMLLRVEDEIQNQSTQLRVILCPYTMCNPIRVKALTD